MCVWHVELQKCHVAMCMCSAILDFKNVIVRRVFSVYDFRNGSVRVVLNLYVTSECHFTKRTQDLF